MKNLKIQKTIYPEVENNHERRLISKNIPLGIMIQFWERNGSFNLDLYKNIAIYKTNLQTI